MTGLEPYQRYVDRKDVQEFLGATLQRLGELMPGWPGWDTPHLLNYRTGAITPTCIEMLLEDAEEWARTGTISRWPKQQVEAQERRSVR